MHCQSINISFVIELSSILTDLENLPKEVNELYFFAIFPDKRETNDLVRILKKIPENIISFYLTTMILDERSEEEARQILAEIPSGVRMLNISAGQFLHQEVQYLVNVLRFIPITVTSFIFHKNQIEDKTTEELTQIFGAILGLTELGLDFKFKQGAERGFSKLFAAIPKTVTSLYLKGTGLKNQSVKIVGEILEAMPRDLKTLRMDDGHWGNRTFKDIIFLLKKLPPELSKLEIGHQVFEPPSMILASKFFNSDADLLKFVNEVTAPIGLLDENDNSLLESPTLVPDNVIDEEMLLTLIQIFEQNPYPITDLICGFLLIGRIENSIPIHKLSDETYLNQRRLKAIHFFRRAASTAGQELSESIEAMILNFRAKRSENDFFVNQTSGYFFSQFENWAEGREDKPKFVDKEKHFESFEASIQELLAKAPKHFILDLIERICSFIYEKVMGLFYDNRPVLI
jgi:hypothetical protein